MWIASAPFALGADRPTETNLPALHQLTVTGTSRRVVVSLEGSDTLDGLLEVVKVPPVRIFVDLPNVVPKVARVLAVDRGAVKRIRVALNQAHPPVTRVVLDLDGAATYRLARGETDHELRIVVEVPPRAPTVVVGDLATWSVGGPLEPGRVVSVSGNRLTVNAQDVPLRDLLEEVADHSGLVLNGHASLTERTTLKFDGLPFERGLHAMLQGHSYGLVSRGAAHGSSRRLGVRGELWVFDPPQPAPKAEVPFSTQRRETQAVSEGAPIELTTAETRRDLEDVDPAEALAAALDHADEKVRLETVEALGRLGGETAAALLEYSWAADRSPEVREAAWAILAHMAVQVR